MLIIANPAEAELIRSWRANEPSRSGGPNARYDFVQASSPQRISSRYPCRRTGSGRMERSRVQGNYDVRLLVESGVLPPGYVVVAASMGKNASGNAMAIREHPDPNQRDFAKSPESARIRLWIPISPGVSASAHVIVEPLA